MTSYQNDSQTNCANDSINSEFISIQIESPKYEAGAKRMYLANRYSILLIMWISALIGMAWLTTHSGKVGPETSSCIKELLQSDEYFYNQMAGIFMNISIILAVQIIVSMVSEKLFDGASSFTAFYSKFRREPKYQ